MRTRRPSFAATSPPMIPPKENPAKSNAVGAGTITSSPSATRPARPSAVCGSGGTSESPNPGMSGTSTRKLEASGTTFRIQ